MDNEIRAGNYLPFPLIATHLVRATHHAKHFLVGNNPDDERYPPIFDAYHSGKNLFLNRMQTNEILKDSQLHPTVRLSYQKYEYKPNNDKDHQYPINGEIPS